MKKPERTEPTERAASLERRDLLVVDGGDGGDSRTGDGTTATELTHYKRAPASIYDVWG